MLILFGSSSIRRSLVLVGPDQQGPYPVVDHRGFGLILERKGGRDTDVWTAGVFENGLIGRKPQDGGADVGVALKGDLWVFPGCDHPVRVVDLAGGGIDLFEDLGFSEGQTRQRQGKQQGEDDINEVAGVHGPSPGWQSWVQLKGHHARRKMKGQLVRE